MNRWRMAAMCSDCPFATSGAGLRLRRSLRPQRWREILRMLRNDGHFHCHQTIKNYYDDDAIFDRNARLCAGAIEWQEKRCLSSQLVRIMERLHRRNEKQC